MSRFTLVVLLLATACSSGPSAPEVGELETVCNDQFCVDVPTGWEGEIGETYLAFHHAFDPDHTFLTVGEVDMQAIVEAAGGSWPVSAEEAMLSFWDLLSDSDVAEFERSTRLEGGSWRSWGVHADGEMWYLLHPVEGSRGIGVEMRAPNDSWESHADAVLGSLVVNE